MSFKEINLFNSLMRAAFCSTLYYNTPAYIYIYVSSIKTGTHCSRRAITVNYTINFKAPIIPATSEVVTTATHKVE